MSDSISLSPEQFIFAQDEDLKTTSLKVAERFGKEHKNVLALIDKVLTYSGPHCPDNFLPSLR